MIKEIIFIVIIMSVALITEIVAAQSIQGQWPPSYRNYSVLNTNYQSFNQNRFPASIQPNAIGTHEYGWRSNYVSPNYDPYVNQSTIGYQRQNRGDYNIPIARSNNFVSPYYARTYTESYIGTNVGYHPMATSSLMPAYGNSFLMPPSMMTYSPWTLGVTPIMTAPLLPLLGWGY